MGFHLGRFRQVRGSGDRLACFGGRRAHRAAVLGQGSTTDDAESEQKCNGKLGVHCVFARSGVRLRRSGAKKSHAALSAAPPYHGCCFPESLFENNKRNLLGIFWVFPTSSLAPVRETSINQHP